MDITLTPELEKFINEEISSGNYDSPNDVLHQGLLLLKERKKRREDLRREIQKGIDDIREGRSKTYSSDDLDSFADEIIERGMKKLKNGNGDK